MLWRLTLRDGSTFVYDDEGDAGADPATGLIRALARAGIVTEVEVGIEDHPDAGDGESGL